MRSLSIFAFVSLFAVGCGNGDELDSSSQRSSTGNAPTAATESNAPGSRTKIDADSIERYLAVIEELASKTKEAADSGSAQNWQHALSGAGESEVFKAHGLDAASFAEINGRVLTAIASQRAKDSVDMKAALEAIEKNDALTPDQRAQMKKQLSDTRKEMEGLSNSDPEVSKLVVQYRDRLEKVFGR